MRNGVGEFLRVRISMDISKPLLRGKMVNIGLAEPVWSDFLMNGYPIFVIAMVS